MTAWLFASEATFYYLNLKLKWLLTGKLRNNPQDFKNLLQEIWFNMYARGSRVVSSSGFEHVFAAEIKNSQISGFHNWLFFKEKEDKNEVNYLGYLKVLSLGNVS